MNPSNSTISAKLQAQETKLLELQLLIKNTSIQCIYKLPHFLNEVCFMLKGCRRFIYKSQTHKNLKCVDSIRIDVVFMVWELQTQLGVQLMQSDFSYTHGSNLHTNDIKNVVNLFLNKHKAVLQSLEL
jgi:hypothetical protein